MSFGITPKMQVGDLHNLGEGQMFKMQACQWCKEGDIKLIWPSTTAGKSRQNLKAELMKI